MTSIPPDHGSGRGAAFGVPPLGGRTLQRFSFETFDVATIRFLRAVDALKGGRQDDTEKWLRRAASMPYDTFEGLHPALAAASIALHNLVHDAMDASDPKGADWMRAAQLAVERAGEAPYLMGTLEDIQQDYELLPQEARAVKELARAHAAVQLPFGTPDMSTDDVVALLRAMAADAVAYGTACEDLELPIVRD